jgi:hypothetical protein
MGDVMSVTQHTKLIGQLHSVCGVGSDMVVCHCVDIIKIKINNEDIAHPYVPSFFYCSAGCALEPLSVIWNFQVLFVANTRMHAETRFFGVKMSTQLFAQPQHFP